MEQTENQHEALPFITVTIKISWVEEEVKKPVPESFTTQVSPGTKLSEILKLAALSNKGGPYDKYTTTYYAGLGHMVVALDDVWQDTATNMYWMIYDEKSGDLTPVGMDEYQPRDMSITVFKYEKSEGSCKK